MKKAKPPQSVIMLVLTAITIVFWAAYGTYQAIRTIPELEVEATLIAPFNANLDTDTLDKLVNRVYFEESQITQSLLVSPILEGSEPDAVEEEVASDLEIVDEESEEAEIPIEGEESDTSTQSAEL